MTDISVIGLGKMGSALARTLLDNGHSVTVWNRSPDKAAPLVATGAQLAESGAEAIRASPATITCLKNHETVTAYLSNLRGHLKGKTIIDLSTGGADEARDLVTLLESAGAGWQIGMINAYPSGIGKPETAILCAGPEDVWADWGDTIRVLGHASDHVGTRSDTIPGLFAAMFTARQGFMFGLIYGGAVCKRAGVSLEAFADVVPVTLGMAGNYADLFIRTVPSGDFADPGATVAVCLAALPDTLSPFEPTGTPDDFPRLMRDVTQAAVENGLEAKELTALVAMLSPD